MPEAHAPAFGRVVQQGSLQQLGVVVAGSEQVLHHVKGMSPIGDRHRREERPSGGRQDSTGQRRLVRADTRRQVADELLDPMHPAATP